jgi:hypothetical protein
MDRLINFTVLHGFTYHVDGLVGEKVIRSQGVYKSNLLAKLLKDMFMVVEVEEGIHALGL